MKHFYKSIPGWFSFADIYAQAVREAKDGAHFVEVGSWKGRSAAFMAVEIINSGKKIRFDCVDTWKGSPQGKTFEDPDSKAGRLLEVFLHNTKPVQHAFGIAINTSVEAAKSYQDNSLDFVFIDADHAYESVKADIAAWWPKVKAGGVMAGDDYYGKGVGPAVREAFPNVESVNGGKHWRVRKNVEGKLQGPMPVGGKGER